MSRHFLLQLAASTLLSGLVAATGCVDEPTPAASRPEVVLPDLRDPPPRSAPRRPPARPRTSVVPAGIFRAQVGGDWVQPRLSDRDLTVLDLRPAPAFARGHLPGAVSDPGGAATLVAARARTAATGKRPPLPSDRPQQTVVLVHSGLTLRDHAVAARVYLALYNAGARRTHLALLRGGYEAWRRQGRPRATRPVPRAPAPARPAPRPAALTPAPRPPPQPPLRGVVIPDAAALAAARKKGPTALVEVVRAHQPPGPGRTVPNRLRVALQPLVGPPGAPTPTVESLKQRLAPVLSGREKTRLILRSVNGLWAALLWLQLTARLRRPDGLCAVYLGPAPMGWTTR